MHLRALTLWSVLSASAPVVGRSRFAFASPGVQQLQAYVPQSTRLAVHHPPQARAGVKTMADNSSGYDGGAVVVYVTVPDDAVAKSLASGIVEKKLAACVNVIPGIASYYWWENQVNVDSEILLMIKTRQDLLHELTGHVKANHPYDECEVISVPITGGSNTYLTWVADSTKRKSL